MGYISKPKPPQVDNYKTVADLQQKNATDVGKENLQLTAMNQDNPYGNLSYSFDPSTGQYTASQQFSPQQQQLLDYLQMTQGTAGQDASKLMQFGNYGDQAPDFSDMSSPLVKQQLEAYTAYNKPYYDQAINTLDNQLRNQQGLTPGDASYDYQMKALRDQQSNQQSNAAAQFEPQAYQQAVTNYQMPAMMSEQLAGFASPNSVIQNLWNTPQSNISTADYIGANANMNQANMAAYQEQMKNRAATISAIGNIATGAMLGPMGAPMGALAGNTIKGLYNYMNPSYGNSWQPQIKYAS